ncbi:hypothetical protein F4679DRAFT_598034 [Xylaria curta]|nr:hypothetical protein F4679DRAFT_598034 [Xylaria curta]
MTSLRLLSPNTTTRANKSIRAISAITSVTRVCAAVSTIPGYMLPLGYVLRHALGIMIGDKIYIHVKEFPEINFIGRLLGPRGRSLAEMNTQSGAKIVIRGKGSVKEKRGKGSVIAKAMHRHDTKSKKSG